MASADIFYIKKKLTFWKRLADLINDQDLDGSRVLRLVSSREYSKWRSVRKYRVILSEFALLMTILQTRLWLSKCRLSALSSWRTIKKSIQARQKRRRAGARV